LVLEFFESEAFIIGYYVLTVSASLLLIKETKKRLIDLKKGKNSIIFAPAAFGIILAYVSKNCKPKATKSQFDVINILVPKIRNRILGKNSHIDVMVYHS